MILNINRYLRHIGPFMKPNGTNVGSHNIAEDFTNAFENAPKCAILAALSNHIRSLEAREIA